ncbi:MAG: sigma-54-dependent Fis family transcriptional regulator [Planctomycetes bacterium]|nr:sigma-54-dependent Fis family transcriptional regulator [Planctomycetota bacterium]
MSLFEARDLEAAEALAGIGYCNPFLPERVTLERRALGTEFLPSHAIVHWQPSATDESYPNFPRLRDRAEQIADAARQQLLSDVDHPERELRMYEDIVLYLLYARHLPALNECLLPAHGLGRKAAVRRAWQHFAGDFNHYMSLPGGRLPSQHDSGHAFAVLVQIHRAFLSIYEYIIGGSMPIARLRASVWQSIFSHDMRRYSRVLYRCLGDVPTLILGPSGSGKELVARAIGHSRYVRFDVATESFAEDEFDDFHPLNLSALAPTLIESELFGHRRGAYSGAAGDRSGWLESCGPAGTVFLDEIGDLEGGIQVKLLRVLQSRVFQRVGETTDRTFLGKIVAATNRDLASDIAQRRFREDLYFRLCADIVQTPTLREQLSDSSADLLTLVAFLTQRIIPGAPSEAASLADEVVAWINTHVGDDYLWPGNIRELEQCVRNIMIRGSYEPSRRSSPSAELSGRQRLASLVAGGVLNLDDLIRHYTSMAFAMEGSYVSAADRLKIDWRTVRQKMDTNLVAEYRQESKTDGFGKARLED